jgi:hypothetical protein
LLVLYNGQPRWKAAIATHELIALSPDSTPWPWQPEARYHLLDMGAFAKDDLAQRSSLVALLFLLQRQHSPEGLQDLLDEIIGWFRQHEGYERLRGLFAELIRETLDRNEVNVSSFRNSLLEIERMKNMLSIDWEAGKEQWIAKGKAEGKAEALTSLLAGRFGAVAPSWQKRIRGATLPTLERWFERAIDAPNLRAVFNPPR